MIEKEKNVLEDLLLHVKKALSKAQLEVDRLQADDKEFLCFEDDRGDIFYGGIAKGKRDLALEFVGKTQELSSLFEKCAYVDSEGKSAYVCTACRYFHGLMKGCSWREDKKKEVLGK